MLEENPDFKGKVADQGRKLGEMWKAISEEERQVWKSKAAEAKAEYDRLEAADAQAAKEAGNASDDDNSDAPAAAAAEDSD